LGLYVFLDQRLKNMTKLHIPEIVPNKGELFPQLKRSGYILIHFPAWIFRIMRDPRVTGKVRTRIMLCSAYILLPFSFLSKKKWGWVGYADDLLLALNTLEMVFKDVPKKLQKEFWGGTRSDLEILEEWVFSLSDFINDIPSKIVDAVSDLRKEKKKTTKKNSSGTDDFTA